MKKFLYFLAGLVALTATTACQDENGIFSPDKDLDRMPMTMFRKNHNTNIGSNDPYGTRLKDGCRNTVQLYWYGVEGAAGYELRYAVATGVTSGLESDWSKNSIATIKVGPETLHYELPDLDYSTDYRFSIRVLHPTDSTKHSLWYGMGNGQEWEDYMGVTTSARYVTPNVIFASDKDYTSFKVYINLKYNDAAYTQQADKDTIAARFEMDANGMFVGRTLRVIPDASNPDAKFADPKFVNNEYDLTDEDIARGYVQITGLAENSTYVVRLRNKNFKGAAVDSYYNDVTMRTKGDPGPAILLKHKITDKVYPDSTWNVGERKYNCMRIDTIIENFNVDPKLAEGQTFYLEGGKAYYFINNVNINKGFTLETDPADVAKGLRAKVYIGGICARQDNPAETQTCNFMFGKALGSGEVDAPIQVENVIFRNIDFDVPEAQTFGHRNASGNGNYFANMYSNGRAVYFDLVELEGCTFQGFIRGFIRTQGSKTKQFKKLRVNNCVFFNNGYYANNGSGYNFINADVKTIDSNILQDCQITNNTFYDHQCGSLVTLEGTLDWPADFKMKVRIENNTFINYSTRNGGTYFNFGKGTPGGSTFTFKRNLIVLAAAADDERALKCAGANVQKISAPGEVFVDCQDNWSVGCRDEHMKDNGIFSGSQFSATKNSFGNLPAESCFINGTNKESLVVKVGATPLRYNDLFVDAEPMHKQVAGQVHPEDHHIAPARVFTGLKYKNDLKVTNHEIYTRNIGDQRWKMADPKAAFITPAPGSAQIRRR